MYGLMYICIDVYMYMICDIYGHMYGLMVGHGRMNGHMYGHIYANFMWA